VPLSIDWLMDRDGCAAGEFWRDHDGTNPVAGAIARAAPQHLFHLHYRYFLADINARAPTSSCRGKSSGRQATQNGRAR
jgi:hypothetical protein